MSVTWTWLDTEEWPQSMRCMEWWVNACRAFGEGGMMGSGTVVILTNEKERRIDVERLTGLKFEEATSLKRKKQAGWGVFTGPE